MTFFDIMTPEITQSLITIILFVIVILIINSVVKRILKSFVEKDSLSMRATVKNIGRVMKFLVALVTVAILFQVNGVNVSSLFASLGIAGAVVALATQDLMKDLISGFYIVNEKSFSVGDVIRYNGEDGLVLEFTLRSTKIKSLISDNKIVISNRNLTDVEVSSSTNFLDIPLPYETERNKATRIFNEIVNEINNFPEVEDASLLGVQSFEKSSIMYRVMFFCDPTVRGIIKRKARSVALDQLAKHGVSIPYEKLDISYSLQSSKDIN